MKLKLSEIRSEGNVRQDLGDVSDLAASIAEQGVLEPLVVKKNGAGYILIAGHRRLAAAKVAKLTEVPVHVVDIKPEDIESAQLAENLHRKDLTPFEVSKAIGVELKKRGFRLDHDGVIPAGLDEVAKEIAQKTGTKIGWVTSMARLVFLPAWATKLLENDNLTIAQAALLLTLPPEALDKIDKDFYKLNDVRKDKYDPNRGRRGEKFLMADLEDFIDKAFGKLLTRAPFPLDEPVGDKAPCVTCAFNTTNTQDLFPTVAGGKQTGVCRMVDCYKSKCSTVTTDVRAAYSKKTLLPFVGYASFSQEGWGSAKPKAPDLIKGFKVDLSPDKKLLAKDIEACTAISADKKVAGKDAAKTYGFAVLRGREGCEPTVVHVRLKGAAKTKATAQHHEDIMPRLIQQVARELKNDLFTKPAAEIVKKIPNGKFSPHLTAVRLASVQLGSNHFEDLGIGEKKGKRLVLKDVSWLDIGRAAFYASVLEGQDDDAKEAGITEEKALMPVATRLMALAKEIRAAFTGSAWNLPPELIAECIAVVKDPKAKFNYIPKQTKTKDDPDAGEDFEEEQD